MSIIRAVAHGQKPIGSKTTARERRSVHGRGSSVSSGGEAGSPWAPYASARPRIA